MEALTAVAAATTAAATPANSSTQEAATSAFGLSFDALLKIILTQLTYQDPLKPMDNFQFVSQLAQFSQIQIGQTTNDRLEKLVSAQSTLQASSMLGRQVDIAGSNTTLTGKVTAVSLAASDPVITIETAGGETISGISLASVTQIRPGD